jgi:hypothetical protein
MLRFLLHQVFIVVDLAVRLIQISHTHRTLFFNDEPLVDAIVVEVVVAWPKHLHDLRVVDRVEADRTVIHLDLRGVARDV